MIARWNRKGLASGSLAVAMGMAFALASPAWAGETFGVESFETSIVSNAEGALATQAGSHPYAMTTAIVFNHVVTAIEEERVRVRAYGDPKDIEVNLPAGMILDPRATEARCTEAELERGGAPAGCPNAAAVGVFSIYLDGFEAVDEPVYNMAPPAGAPAELGFDAAGIGLIMHVGGRVRTGGDYGMSADISGISQRHPIYGVQLTLWGDPSAASHDQERGLCAGEEAKQRFKETGIRGSCPVERITKPFLTLPSSCTGEPLETTMSVDSWQEPGDLNPEETPGLSDPRWKTAGSSSSPVTGCEDLAFSPSLDVRPAPEVAAADSPTGLKVDLKIPHEESAEGLAGAELKQLTVTLPAGMAISLSGANGLGACTNAPEPGRPGGQIALHSAEPARCPESSELGEAEVVTPLLQGSLKGAVYLARPETFEGSLIGLYVVLEGGGVQIKLAGKAALDPDTGQITIAFDDAPQLPLSEIRLSLFGGPRAVLVTPPGCGAYTTTSRLAPWSGAPAVTESSTLELASGPNGGACPDGLFSPSFVAGTTNSKAGAFSPFSVTFSRRDGEQRLSRVRVVGPPGLLAALTSAERCLQAQASKGECGQASEIGEASIAAGSGVDPFWITGGKIYLTGPTPPEGSTLPAGGLDPSAGAPFGLAIVIPAVAGPFDLGKELVRARVEVDSHTARVVISSDPLPAMAKGVPLDIRTVNMTIGRPGFMFNPTSCAPLSVTGTLFSAGGASATVASPFEAVNCASLPFKPKLTASTRAKTSRSDGASLDVKIVSAAGQANVGKVRVILPQRLPARLTTLQQACPDTAFDVDPASCPAASIVGGATAVTPMLAHPLTGPVYLVSHGAAFPDLAVVLRGEGIVVYLDGNLDIKKSLTSATFNSIPDMPIGTFTIDFPEGPHSILGTDIPAKTKGMCGQKLTMPTAITAQNGARVTQTTKVTVSGCPKKAKAIARKGK